MPSQSRRPIIYCREINPDSRLVVEGIADYGMPDTFQRKLIKMQKTTVEATSEYASLVEEVKNKFNFEGEVVLLRRESPVFWNVHGIDSFYELLLSNRNNPVIYISPKVTDQNLRSYILPHEFGHHHFFYFEKFPVVVRDDVKSRPWHLNLILLDEPTAAKWVGTTRRFPDPMVIAWDLYERIADYAIDKRLTKLGWGEGVTRNWLRGGLEDVWNGYQASAKKAGLLMNDSVRTAFRKYVGLLGVIDASIMMMHLEDVGREQDGRSVVDATASFVEGLTREKLDDFRTQIEPILNGYLEIDQCVNSLWNVMVNSPFAAF